MRELMMWLLKGISVAKAADVCGAETWRSPPTLFCTRLLRELTMWLRVKPSLTTSSTISWSMLALVAMVSACMTAR